MKGMNLIYVPIPDHIILISIPSFRNAARIPQTYRLNISDVPHNQTHTMNFPGTKTLLEVKMDVSELIGIPVKNQLWTGWPPNTTDDASLINKINFVFNNVLTHKLLPVDVRKLWNLP